MIAKWMHAHSVSLHLISDTVRCLVAISSVRLSLMLDKLIKTVFISSAHPLSPPHPKYPVSRMTRRHGKYIDRATWNVLVLFVLFKSINTIYAQLCPKSQNMFGPIVLYRFISVDNSSTKWMQTNYQMDLIKNVGGKPIVILICINFGLIFKQPS